MPVDKQSTDLKGTVIIKCILVNAKGAVKGNLITTLRVANSTVSEVNAAISKHLFGDS